VSIEITAVEESIEQEEDVVEKVIAPLPERENDVAASVSPKEYATLFELGYCNVTLGNAFAKTMSSDAEVAALKLVSAAFVAMTAQVVTAVTLKVLPEIEQFVEVVA